MYTDFKRYGITPCELPVGTVGIHSCVKLKELLSIQVQLLGELQNLKGQSTLYCASWNLVKSPNRRFFGII